MSYTREELIKISDETHAKYAKEGRIGALQIKQMTDEDRERWKSVTDAAIEIVHKYDANKDGRIDRFELEAMSQEDKEFMAAAHPHVLMFQKFRQK